MKIPDSERVDAALDRMREVRDQRAAAPEFSFVEQLKEVRRELAYRERVYTRWVAEGRMTARNAEHHKAIMRAVAETLKPLADLEEAAARDANPGLALGP